MVITSHYPYLGLESLINLLYFKKALRLSLLVALDSATSVQNCLKTSEKI